MFPPSKYIIRGPSHDSENFVGSYYNINWLLLQQTDTVQIQIFGKSSRKFLSKTLLVISHNFVLMTTGLSLKHYELLNFINLLLISVTVCVYLFLFLSPRYQPLPCLVTHIYISSLVLQIISFFSTSIQLSIPHSVLYSTLKFFHLTTPMYTHI